MERYIKYKRFVELLEPHEIQKFLDDIITEGWEIIYYNEIGFVQAGRGFIFGMEYTIN